MVKKLILAVLVVAIGGALFYQRGTIEEVLNPPDPAERMTPYGFTLKEMASAKSGPAREAYVKSQYSGVNTEPGPHEVELPDGRVVAWPPKLGEEYPDLALYNEKGELVRLSDYKGSVLIIEPFAMTCRACIAWSGAYLHGKFRGMWRQTDLNSFEIEYERQVKYFSIGDSRIKWVQIMFYDMAQRAPNQQDLKAWADHFKNDKRDIIFLYADEKFQGRETFDLIPGFQVVDKDFILRADATGHHPDENLYTSLMRKIRGLVREVQPFLDEVENAVLDHTPRYKYRNNVVSMIVDRRFDELEAMMYEMYDQNARFLNGGWKQKYYMDALKMVRDISLLEEWAQKYPESPIPLVGLASLYWYRVFYFWEDVRNDPKEKQAYLEKSLKLIEKAETLEPKIPEMYRWKINILKELGREDDIRKTFQEGIELYPWYDQLIGTYGWAMWTVSGKDETALQIAEEVEKIGGPMYYSEVARNVADPTVGKEGVAKFGFDWDKIKEGFDYRYYLFPESSSIRRDYSQMTYAMKDKEKLKEILATMRADRAKHYVYSNQENSFFDEMMDWAFDVEKET